MLSALHKYRDREDGFTLIELLIVVLIIGILAAVAIPVYLGIQTTARHSSVQADVNITVKRVQVSLTEGGTLGAAATSFTDSSARSDKNTVTTTNLTSGNAPRFTVQGVSSVDGYTYTYDSGAGTYTESTTSLGGSGTATALPVLSYTNSTTANNGDLFGTQALASNYTYNGYAVGTKYSTALVAYNCDYSYFASNTANAYVKFAATGGGVTYSITNDKNGTAGSPGNIGIDSSTGYLTGTFNGGGANEMGITVTATNSFGSTTKNLWFISGPC